jgi:hypothetical protein
VTGWEFENLSFSTIGESFLNEFVISVNNSAGTQYMDALPSNAASGGSFGPASGAWGSAVGGSEGAPFVVADGLLSVTVYELFVDPGVNAVIDAEAFAKVFAAVFATMLEERVSAWAPSVQAPMPYPAQPYPTQLYAALPQPVPVPVKQSFWSHAKHVDVLLLSAAMVIVLVVLAAWLA